MNKKGLLAIILIFFMLSISYAQDYKTGTLENNIIVEDLDGKTYDLHSELSKGKHLLFFSVFLT